MRAVGLVLLALLISACEPQRRELPLELRVAVASNFAPTLVKLADAYTQRVPVKIQTMVGSTGLLTAQIEAGAPFDLFFAADAERPAYLEQAGKTVGPGRTYALGQLALWMPSAGFKPVLSRLREGEFERLAIANPELAPYGMAARQTLEKLQLWDALQTRMIRGENIAKTYHYVSSDRVDMAFVAWPQLAGRLDEQLPEVAWRVPAEYHSPLRQQVVLLRGPKQEAAAAFFDFCLNEPGREIIARAGYALPELD